MTETDKIKPSCVLTCYYRPKPGGFCKRLFRAINSLLARGHTVHYLAVVRFPIDHPNCHFHRFFWPKNYTSGYLFWAFFHLVGPLQLFYLGLRYRVNCLFAFGGHNYGLFLQPLRIIKGIPLAIFLRADAIENHRLKGRSNLLIWLEGVFEGLAIYGARIYGVSEVLTQEVVARHRFLKSESYGVLRNDIRQASVTKKEKIQQPLRLACVGILEPRKNQRFLLEVMKEIDADQAQLFLYGIGPDEQLLKKTVESEELTGRVQFMGWVSEHKIWPEVDLLLVPSLHEGAPNAVLEALGSGVAVITSNIPEHAEILSGKCMLPLGDFMKWVEAIKYIIQDPEIQLQRIVNEQKVAAQQLLFDWDETICRYIIQYVEEPGLKPRT